MACDCCEHEICNWDCTIHLAKSNGGTVNTPNNLPIKAVKFDNSMWEHSHGDHADYKFPIEVEFIGQLFDHDFEDYRCMLGAHEPPADKDVRKFKSEVHALIYTDGCMALTLYECVYAMFSLRSGESIGGHMWKKADWRLSDASLKKVCELDEGKNRCTKG